ncbi:MAG: PDZ domain-containing protein [Nannocystaceae bacterium]|nr:PDZ domain-containing protein [Nannocystaceae bacterium]
MTQETVIQKELIATIASDGRVLLAQDRARLVEFPAGYYALQSVHRDDFAYHLGLRPGDKILSANGMTLKNLGDYVDALAALRNATSLSITYERAETTTTVDFRVE